MQSKKVKIKILIRLKIQTSANGCFREVFQFNFENTFDIEKFPLYSTPTLTFST